MVRPVMHAPHDSVSMDLEKAMGRFLRQLKQTHKSPGVFALHCIDGGPIQAHHVQRLVDFWSEQQKSSHSSSTTDSGPIELSFFRVDWGTDDVATSLLCQYLQSRVASCTLQAVRFRACQWNGEQTRQVVQALATMEDTTGESSSLHVIVIDGAAIASATDLWQSILQRHRALQILEISGQRVATFGASTDSLAAGLQQHGKSLTSLAVTQCHLEYETARPLLQSLECSQEALPRLTCLDLHSNQLSSLALPALTTLLHRGNRNGDHRLQELNLSSNPHLFSGAPWQHVEDFAQALADNVHLLTLLLRTCGVSFPVLQILAQALVNNTTLQNLNVQQMADRVVAPEDNDNAGLIVDCPLAFWDRLGRWKGVHTFDVDAPRLLDTMETRRDTIPYWVSALRRNTSLTAGSWCGLLPRDRVVVAAVLQRNQSWHRARTLLDDDEWPDGGIWSRALAILAVHPTATFCCLQERLADWTQLP